MRGGGLVSTLFSSVRHYVDVGCGGEHGGMELCFLAGSVLGGVQEIGAVTMEAGIRVVVGVGRWTQVIYHC